MDHPESPSTPPPIPVNTPQPTRERVAFLDILRGIALLGILPVNIAFFALPLFRDYALEARWDARPVGDLIVHYLTHFFFTYKFITLFSLLFGIGLVLLRRKMTEGSPQHWLVVRRLGWLGFFGVIHGVVIWFGDILATYAVIGLILVWVGRYKPKVLKWVGVILIMAPMLLLTALLALLVVIQSDPELAKYLTEEKSTSGLDVIEVEAMTWSEYGNNFLKFDPAFETAIYREGPFLQALIYRAFCVALFVIACLFYYGWRIAGLFLLGMAWAKEGWILNPAAHRDRFRRFLILGLLTGVPLQLFSALLLGMGWGDVAGSLAGEILLYLGSLGMAAAVLGGLGLLVASRPDAIIFRPLQAVGRTAFSNYIFQSLVCTTVFYSQGLAQFGLLNKVQMGILVLVIWGTQMGLSLVWLRYFQFGPLEWLWRSLTYWKVQKLRKPTGD